MPRRRVAEMLRRLLGLAQRLGRPSAPVFGARDRQRRLGGDRGLGEALRRLPRVAEEAQRDPAGVERAVDLVRRIGRGRGLDAQVERQPRLVEVEKLARHHPPLAPPAVGIDERVAVGGRKRQEGRGLVGAAGATRVLDSCEEKPGIGPERLGNRPDQGGRQGAARGGDAGGGQPLDVGAGERGGAGGGAKTLRVEKAVGAALVIGLGQDRTEVAQDRALGPGVGGAVAPQRAHARDRLVRPAQGVLRARKRKPASARRRLRRREEGDDLRGPGLTGEQVRLLARAQVAVARPVRMGGGERPQRGEGGMRVGAQRRPFEGEAAIRIAFGARERGERGDVALPVGDGGGKDDCGGRRRRGRRGARLLAGRKGAAKQTGRVLGQGLDRGRGGNRRPGLRRRPVAEIAAKRQRPAQQGGGVHSEAFDRRARGLVGCGDRRGNEGGVLETVRAAQRRRDDEGDDGDGREDRGGPDPHALNPSGGPWSAFADESLTPARAPLPPFPRGPAGLWELTRAARPRPRAD